MTSEARELRGYVLLTEAPNLQWAHLIAGRLEENGIPAHAEDDVLADEWAMSQKMMGTLGVRVLVPGDRLAEAQAIFLAMSQPMPGIQEDDPELEAYAADKRASHHRIALWGVILLFGLPLVAAAAMWLAERLGWGGPW